MQARASAGEGADTVVLVDGAWKIVDQGRALAIHGRDPQREADRTAAELLDGRPTDVLVVIGLALGFLLDALERRGWTGRVLALEPEPATVPALLARRDWSAWLEADRLRILHAPAFTGATDCWRWFGDGSSEPLVFVHPVMDRVKPAEVAAARAALRRIRFDAQANAAARRQHGARYLLNTLRNLPAIAAEPGVSRLSSAAPHCAAVVVAAGPSLDAALPALREAQHSALIVAVDTALRPLLHAGVVPHVVVAVDPSEANGRHLLDLPPCPDTHLVAEASLDPLAIDRFRGRTFLFAVSEHHPWPWLRAAGRQPAPLRAWGSVLTTAFDLAVTMGCDPVAFVGADLAYSGGRPYCHGVSFEEDWRRLSHWGEPIEGQLRQAIDQHPAIEEPDVAGGSVRTAPHLVAFRNWLVEQMAKEQGRRFINATGAGILRGASIAQVTPGELVALLPPPDSSLRRLVRDQYRANSSTELAAATAALITGLGTRDEATESIVAAWEEFAPGITREALRHELHAAARALAAEAAGTPRDPADDERRGDAAERYAEPGFEPAWLQQLAAAMPLVPMRIPAHRMQRAPSGARVFRFRTSAARIICCALRPQEGAVAEDGRPLSRAIDLDHVEPGSYSVCRDEVHFRATDDSDPRRNAREYTFFVPPPVAYVEALPLQEILERQI